MQTCHVRVYPQTFALASARWHLSGLIVLYMIMHPSMETEKWDAEKGKTGERTHATLHIVCLMSTSDFLTLAKEEMQA